MLLGLWLMLGVCSLTESLLEPVLTYSSETMIRREEERSRIRAVQMDNIRGLVGIRRMDKVVVEGTKGVHKKIDEDVL